MSRKAVTAKSLARGLQTEQKPLSVAREEAERKHILAALQHTKGNRTHAARMLGISRKTLWKKLKQLGILSPFSVTVR